MRPAYPCWISTPANTDSKAYWWEQQHRALAPTWACIRSYFRPCFITLTINHFSSYSVIYFTFLGIMTFVPPSPLAVKIPPNRAMQSRSVNIVCVFSLAATFRLPHSPAHCAILTFLSTSLCSARGTADIRPSPTLYLPHTTSTFSISNSSHHHYHHHYHHHHHSSSTSIYLLRMDSAAS